MARYLTEYINNNDVNTNCKKFMGYCGRDSVFAEVYANFQVPVRVDEYDRISADRLAGDLRCGMWRYLLAAADCLRVSNGLPHHSSLCR